MRIVFLCSTSTQVQTFLPLMQELTPRGINDFHWIVLDPYYGWDAASELHRHGIKYISVRRSQCLIRQLPILVLYRYLLTEIRNEIAQLISALSPSLLVVGNDRGIIEKQFINIAQSSGCKVVLVQDGLLWKTEVYKFRFADLLNLKRQRALQKVILRHVLSLAGYSYLAPSYIGQAGCDLIAVMGNASRNVLVDRGVSPVKIAIVGQPRYDRFLKNYSNRDPQEKFCSGAERYSIAIFPTAFAVNLGDRALQDQQTVLIREAISHFLNNNRHKVSISIKPHPRENINEYRFVDGLSDVSLVTDISSVEIIANADIVISAPSTVIAEAALFRKPLAVLRIGLESASTVTELLGVKTGDILEIKSRADFDRIGESLFTNSKDTLSTFASELVYVDDTSTASGRLTSLLFEQMM